MIESILVWGGIIGFIILIFLAIIYSMVYGGRR